MTLTPRAAALLDYAVEKLGGYDHADAMDTQACTRQGHRPAVAG